MRERLLWFWRRIRGQKVHKVTSTTIGGWDDSAIDDPTIPDEALFYGVGWGAKRKSELYDKVDSGISNAIDWARYQSLQEEPEGVKAAKYFGAIFATTDQRDIAIRLMHDRIHRERVAQATARKTRLQNTSTG